MVAAADIDWVVISLARTPERLAQFRATNAGIALDIETQVAVDGLELDLEALTAAGEMEPDLRWSRGAIGGSFSHRDSWRRAVASGRPVGIFEDDVVLRHDFLPRALDLMDTLPADWDLLMFGFNTDSVADFEFFSGFHMRVAFLNGKPTADHLQRFAISKGKAAAVRMHNAFGVCAYVVSPKGAQKLIDGSFPLSMRSTLIEAFPAYYVSTSGDGLRNALYRQMSCYAALPLLAMPINDHKSSTIWG